MTWDIKVGCMGKPEREAAMHLLSAFPNISLDLDTYLLERNILQDQLWPSVSLLPGIQKLVHHLKAHNIPMAVATGSRRRNYEMKTAHLQDVFGCFESKVVCADDMKFKMNGKPEPDIFLVAARELLGFNVGGPEGPENSIQKQERSKGLVLEDSILGMQAGKKAGMSVVWVPDTNLLDVGYSGDEQADQMLKSMSDFIPEQWGLPPYASS